MNFVKIESSFFGVPRRILNSRLTSPRTRRALMRLASAFLSRVSARHIRVPPVSFSPSKRTVRPPLRSLISSRPKSTKSECAHPRETFLFRRPPLLSSTAFPMEDYPVDEDAVNRGEDERIKSAVESAVLMGFASDDATREAKRIIIQFPGRRNVDELVVDALLANAGGGQRAFELPKAMPQRYADNAHDREKSAKAKKNNTNDAAIDLTESPEKRDVETSRKKQKTEITKDVQGKATVITLDDDDTVTAKEFGNDLIRQLAAERRARDAVRGGNPQPTGKYAATPRVTSGALSGGGGSGGLSSGLTGAAARAAATAAASSSFGSSGIIDALLQGTNKGLTELLSEVRVLTYNVWFAEHVALADRVQGLSDVITENDPHVICLQEVTPNILMLLHAMPWFEEFKCTPPPSQQYFTVVLFKQNMNKADKTTRLVRRNFPNSRMGRYADGAAGMDCGGGVELTVMSSHLESFLSKTDTSSAERVSQMRDCFRVLDGIIDRRVEEKTNRGEGAPGKTKNAIFAGDTNWDEKSDGDVPLGSEWSDAWVTNGDGSPGYTYDLRKNQMMSGWLQKRLDRVFFRLESFDVSKIEMVGNEPIKRKDGSTITYVNEWKGRSETKPVLPSDHFGLLVTLQKK